MIAERSKLTLALSAILFAAGTVHAATLSGDSTTPGEPGDGYPSVTYVATTGELIMDTEGGHIWGFIFDSVAGIFTGSPPIYIGGTIFTTDTDFRIAEQFVTPNLSGVHSLGPVAQTGLSEAFLLNDLTLFADANPGFDFDLIVVPAVPEPATLLLVAIGLVALLARRRQRQAT